MIALDIHTLILANAVSCLVPAVAIIAQPATKALRPARCYWALGFMSMGLGWLFVAARNLLPDTLSIIGANTGLVAGYAALAFGIEAFARQRSRVALFGIVALVTFATFALFETTLAASVNQRIALAGGLGLVLTGVIAWTVHRHLTHPYRRQGLLLLGLLGLVAVILIICVVEASTRPTLPTVFHTSDILSMSHLGKVVVQFGMGMAILSLIHHSLRRALEQEVVVRDQILGLIGHDLRTPFNTLLGGSEAVTLFLDSGKLDKARETADQINQAAQRAHTLLEDLLAWGRSHTIETDLKTKDAVGAYKVADLIDHALAPSEPARREKGVAAHVDAGDLAISAPPDAVCAVLRNLISNAVKFAPQESCLTLRGAQTGRWVEISVIDEGPGLPDHIAKALNEGRPPRTPSASMDGDTGGLGLFLAVTIAASVGGRLRAEPTEKGACITVRLPS